jgi:multidrug resistance efflux pump
MARVILSQLNWAKKPRCHFSKNVSRLFPIFAQTTFHLQNIQAMINFVLKIGALLVAGILIYNFFFGTDAEKENSRKVFGQVKEVVVSVGQLVKSEKTKFDAGKYDAALEKLGSAYEVVRKQAQHLDASFMNRLDELEKRKAALQTELDNIEQGDQDLTAAPTPKKGIKKDPKAEEAKAAKSADQQRRKEELQRELDQLFKDSETLLQQAQEQE